MPDHSTCEQARLSRDARFDGLFFTAVTSTGIYCRPVCPAPTPKAHNVRYFASAAAAEAAGFRPCLRCRPELAPGDRAWLGADALLDRALALIDEGLLASEPVATLAARVGVGERHLRRLFVDRLGVAPLGVHATRRLLFAKQLLTETALPITEVALAAGYGSLRRFNDSFARAYRLAPRDLRRQRGAAAADLLRLRLGYRPPFDFAATLAFLRGRALPGVEQVDGDSYARVCRFGTRTGWWRVRPLADEHALLLEVGGVGSEHLLALVARVRRMFDLDADPQAIGAVLQRDPALVDGVREAPGLRLPGAWDGFETAVRAVLGQQVSVAAARALARRLVERHGAPSGLASPAPTRLFPAAAVLAEADPASFGIPQARARTLLALARAVADGQLDFAPPSGGLDDWQARLTGLPGIGAWTAHYLALRVLGHPDAFPAGDLVLRRAAGAGTPLSERALQERAERWRPWRAYAAIHLWRRAARPVASGSTMLPESRYPGCSVRSLQTPLGELAVVADDQAIVAIEFRATPPTATPLPAARASLLRAAMSQLDDYFAGRRTVFELPLSPRGTAFQQRVWRELQAIPFGATDSYGALAARLGTPNAARAVGAANRSNPIAIVVPCHRVIGRDGSLTGYAGGLERKQRLLALEAEVSGLRLRA